MFDTTEMPQGWSVRYAADGKSAYVYPDKGGLIIVR